MTDTKAITVAYGDGIGPEIMEATLHILREAKAPLSIETIEVGERQYKLGEPTGIPKSAWDSLKRTKVLLKAPITTPQGGGYKSLNVTMRKTLGLYANVRPCVCYAPYVKTHHPLMDMVIVRENEEDIYSGIEYRQSEDLVHSIKVITRSGSEKIVRYAFEYAVRNGRKKVTCMSKDNIMKMADGLFHKVFDEIGAEYPDIAKDHYIIDIGAARIASAPERFDVVVTENLYGDIISDIAAEVSGSVGLAGSANIGKDFAMFEAIHGSAPDIAGKAIANPSGLLGGAVMMLVHLGLPETATLVQNAWLKTIEDGIHTADIFSESSKQKVSTQEFANAVAERLGQSPSTLKAAAFGAAKPAAAAPKSFGAANAASFKEKTLIGTDIYVYWNQQDLNSFGDSLMKTSTDALTLELISCKGLKVYPGVTGDFNYSDQLRCRYRSKSPVTQQDIAALIAKVCSEGFEFIKVENLYNFDGQPGYTAGQGE